MENQILLITDFSKASWNALIYGMEIYKTTKAKFFILHCYKKELLKQDKKEQKIKSEIGLQRIMQGIGFRKENLPHEFETISSSKKVPDAVREIVGSFKIDLIILGSKGDFAGINYAYHNWVSEILQNLESCTTLVIPETSKFNPKEFNEMVFPTPFNNSYRSSELKTFIALARLTNSTIRVLEIQESNGTLNQKQLSNKENLRDLFQGVNFTFHTLTQTTISTGIRLFIQSRDSSMLSLYRRKQGFFSRLFNQSMEKDIEFDPSVPVLLIPEIPGAG
ncbi:universal stress protein [Antarcticibacterium flavum]|uniref:Universal stress protein n=1 Tax=Antarcticibacterium flavum TaxID=2058175 RepID=A0A5B7X7E4_9FLAO|nr:MULTISPECIES: universal stress protein [Antarcticibacterium]MCM4159239.1 universal stress protein [Antarcticibacterium sp. W02-3]QCY71045.1 universal stress protein [Antarcticibacterium flavum]